eukprot:gene5494-3966_t
MNKTPFLFSFLKYYFWCNTSLFLTFTSLPAVDTLSKMFRRAAPFLVRRTLPLLQSVRDVPEGFEFIEHKVVDKDVHAHYENLDTLKFTLTRQDEFIFRETPVKCLTVTGANGEAGIYPGHAYEIMKLAPAPLSVEFPDGHVKKFFSSGGFAHINNEGSCDVNTVECIPLEELDVEAAEKALAEQQQALSKAADEKAKAIVEVRIGVIESVIHALKH